MNKSAKHFSIRKSDPADYPFLGAVERSAASLFRTAGLDFLADGPTLKPSLISTMGDTGHLWVAVDEDNHPIGFLAGCALDSSFHIAELSVEIENQNKGIGKSLIRNMIDHLKRESSISSVTLTTFRDIPWNGPWYLRQGFVEVDAQDIGSAHMAVVAQEIEHGHDMRRRCVMRKLI